MLCMFTSMLRVACMVKNIQFWMPGAPDAILCLILDFKYTCSSTFSEKKIWIQLLIFKHCCIIFFGKHNLPRPCISLAMQMYFPFYAPVVTCYDGCRQKPLLPSFESAEMRNLAETLLRYTVSKIFAWHHSCGTLYCCYYNFLVQCLQGYNSWESRC
jgi:hypothetical protein